MKHTKRYMELVGEWSPKNKGELDTYKAASRESVWWVCRNGHEWKATLKGRFSGNGCPYCEGGMPVPGVTDVATLFPDLISEWDPDLNGGRKLSEFGRGSGFKAWWRCKEGHVWESRIFHRTQGRGCPYCKGRIPDKDNNLVAVLPHVAKYWNYERNEKMPEDYLPHSSKIVWWKCEKGHEWYTSINAMSRKLGENGCPYCTGKYPIEGETDLATVYPDLILEWDWEMNEKMPEEFTASSNKIVYWICPQGHRYKATIANRTRGKGCSLCNRGWKPIK